MNNTSAQLDLDKASSLAKENRIKSLEEIIIELGHDPKDAKGIKALMKNKEEDIAALRKQLKLPPSMHPQTTEVVQQKSEEDMMDLLMKLNERLTDTEQALEKALKEKQGESTSHPPEEIPAVTTAPSTLITALPPTVQASTAEIITGTLAIAVAPGSSNTSTEELIRAMEELKLQVSELKLVKEQLAKVEKNYDKSKMNVAEKTREVKTLENKVRALEKDLPLDKPLAEIRGILWTNINQSLSDVWRSIQVIYEQIDLIRAAQVEIQKTRALLEQMPEQVNRLIHFLNTKTSEELEALKIRDRIGTIL